MCVAGNGPSTSRSLFLRNALISLICEMGSNFGVLQLIWAVLFKFRKVFPNGPQEGFTERHLDFQAYLQVILFQLEVEKKKATSKAKILPKARKINCSIRFQLEFE